MELLTATKWEMPNKSGNGDRLFEQYTSTKIYSELIYKGILNTDDKGSDFYLSDTIVQRFESDKVGKIKNGKYIVKKMHPLVGFQMAEIVRLTDKELIINWINISPEEINREVNQRNWIPVVFGKMRK